MSVPNSFYNEIAIYKLKCVVNLVGGGELVYEKCGTRSQLIGKQVFHLPEIKDVISARFDIYHLDVPDVVVSTFNFPHYNNSRTGLIRTYNLPIENFPNRF